jgi:hypothetical protein
MTKMILSGFWTSQEQARSEPGSLGLIRQETYNCSIDLLHLLEKTLFLLVPTTGIDNDDFEALFLEQIHTLLSYTHRIVLKLTASSGNMVDVSARLCIGASAASRLHLVGVATYLP